MVVRLIGKSITEIIHITVAIFKWPPCVGGVLLWALVVSATCCHFLFTAVSCDFLIIIGKGLTQLNRVAYFEKWLVLSVSL